MTTIHYAIEEVGSIKERKNRRQINNEGDVMLYPIEENWDIELTPRIPLLFVAVLFSLYVNYPPVVKSYQALRTALSNR